MTPPDEKPAPKPAELLPKQVQWGARKPAAPLPPPATLPENPAPNLSAKQVPWSAYKKNPAPADPSLAPEVDPMVTHMPWAVQTGNTRPPTPPPKPKGMFAKLVPWSSAPAKKLPAAEARAPESAEETMATWALPKTKDSAATLPTPDQSEMEFARESQGRRVQANEPTAEQLVALLSRMAARAPATPAEPTPTTPYKARPISFEATRADVIKLFAAKHRRGLTLGSVGLGLALAVLYLMRLASLNSALDRQWVEVDRLLRQRYAVVPQYVECILSFSEEERFTLAFTEHGLAAWRTAKTDQEVEVAAARMERILIMLAKVMRRCEKGVPAPEPNQIESSKLFAELEEQRQQSRVAAAGLIQSYNAAVEEYNSKIESAPGSWVAGAASLHPRRPLFTKGG